MPPGIYLPDATEDITRVADLPQPQVVAHVVNHASLPCPRCGGAAGRLRVQHRTLHEIGDPVLGVPRDLRVTYSQHRCKPCRLFFNADMTGLAAPGSHYTNRVVSAAVRSVVEDGLPYRTASWHLWRDHRVFVPAATVQNWVEASGEKSPGQGRRRVPRRRPGGVQRIRGG